MPTVKIFPISQELLDNACFAVEGKYQLLPFFFRGITIDRRLIRATLEILNAEPLHKLQQNCRNDIRERTPEGLDRRIKEYLGSDLRTANIVTDVLETAGIVRNIKMPSSSTGRDIKGTQLLDAWVWISDKEGYPQSESQKPERIDHLYEKLKTRIFPIDRESHQPMQTVRDINRSAFYCSDLLLVSLKAGDIASAIKYASDLVTFSDGEIRDAAKELVYQLEVRMESGLNEIPVELITKADHIAHKVKLGFETM